MILKSSELCLLVDNGSVRDHAVLFSRKIAHGLEREKGIPVIATSLAHSDKICSSKLNDQSVPLLEPLLRELEMSEGLVKLYVLPLLMVSGGAIFQKIERHILEFSARNPNVSVDLGRALVDPSGADEISIPCLLADAVKKEVAVHDLSLPEVLIVDHGSPYPIAAEMRNWVAQEVARKLPPGVVAGVTGVSMERREGRQYDFNEPLLSHALESLACREGGREVVIAKMFIQPGKHSGKRGDIEGIVNAVVEKYAYLKVFTPNQIFTQKDLRKLLLGRLTVMSASAN